MSKLREPFSGISHLLGWGLSIAGLVALLLVATPHAGPWHTVSFAIFGASLILLYGASALYHLLPASPHAVSILRRIDHMMIYVLIAGTYTPLALVPLRGAWGWSLLIPIWVIAILGIILTAITRSTPRWLYTVVYVAMGWFVVVAARPLSRALPPGSIAWLVGGGLCYTIGAIGYGLKWPRLKPGVFGFHELWHLFVMAGSFSHYWLVFRYVAALP
jgi:hemolysin III